MLEVISIHINKTAGKTFKHILSRNYEQNLFCVNTDNSGKWHRSLSCKTGELTKMIPSHAKALHGHFCAKDIIGIANNTPIIAWLRNPIDRVVSNYFHDTNNKYTILDMDEYVSQECNINKISKMLDGLSLEKLIIGFQENFSEDVKRIGKIFGWTYLETPMINVGVKDSVPNEILRLIESLNNEDIKLYNSIKN